MAGLYFYLRFPTGIYSTLQNNRQRIQRTNPAGEMCLCESWNARTQNANKVGRPESCSPVDILLTNLGSIHYSAEHIKGKKILLHTSLIKAP